MSHIKRIGVVMIMGMMCLLWSEQATAQEADMAQQHEQVGGVFWRAEFTSRTYAQELLVEAPNEPSQSDARRLLRPLGVRAGAGWQYRQAPAWQSSLMPALDWIAQTGEGVVGVHHETAWQTTLSNHISLQLGGRVGIETGFGDRTKFSMQVGPTLGLGWKAWHMSWMPDYGIPLAQQCESTSTVSVCRRAQPRISLYHFAVGRRFGR